MTHTRHFILQPQPEGTWGVRGGECFSCAAQAAAGSRLLTMFCYLQAAVADFSFQHLALLLFAGCLVPKGKLWWLMLGGAAGHETPASRSIPVPPFPPTHMGLSALWTGCGTAGRCLQPSVSAWSRCLLSLLCFQLSLLPLNTRAFSLLSPLALSPILFPWRAVGQQGQSAQDARGSPSWDGVDLPFSSCIITNKQHHGRGSYVMGVSIRTPGTCFLFWSGVINLPQKINNSKEI